MMVDMSLIDTDDSQEYPKFMAWVKAKQGHLVQLWHKLDQDRSMMLHKGEFAQGLKKLKYPGNVDRLWNLIDRDTTGNISFIEFAPEAALDLAHFKRWAEQSFGGARKLFSALDEDQSGGVTYKEFSQAVKSKGLPEELHHSIRTLFLMLDHGEAAAKGSISVDQLSFLDVWKPPPYLWETPDFDAREKFQNALLSRNNHNRFLAWRRALDKDASMRVSYEEFIIQCKALQKRGIAEAAPPCGMLGLYVAFDQARRGWFTLRDWCPETFEHLSRMLHWCRAHYGTVSKFIKAAEAVESLDDDKREGLTYSKFSAALKPLDMPHALRVEIFEGLQIKSAHPSTKGRIFAADGVFLMKWDPEREIKEDRMWSTMMERRGHMKMSATV